jgi:hypothetical protein
MNKVVSDMKVELMECVEEWLGLDIPDEGTSDYDTWLMMIEGVNNITSIYDVVEYLETKGRDFASFIIDGEYDLVAAGMLPIEVPFSVIEILGKKIEIRLNEEVSSPCVYRYGNKIYLYSFGNQELPLVFDELDEMLESLGVKPARVAMEKLATPITVRHSPNDELRQFMGSISKRLANRSQATIYVIVPKWPDGTMAFKFGSALNNSLYVSKEEMHLVQMSPERIFRVKSAVTEQEFRDTIALHDVARSIKVFFIAI